MISATHKDGKVSLYQETTYTKLYTICQAPAQQLARIYLSD